MSSSDILSLHLSLFSPVHQQKPRFMALASAVLSQAADLLSLYRSAVLSQAADLLSLYRSALPSALSPESAEGFQLDTLGLLAGIPRPSASTSDADYRAYLRAKTALHHWDGTNGSLPALLAEAFPGMDARLTDNQDGTVTASLSGSAGPFPFPLKDVFPRPAGIRLTENQ